MISNQNPNQLSLFGLSHDQTSFMSTEWGCLTFYPTRSDKWTDTCRHCILWKHKDQQTDSDECLSAPCSSQDRNDGLSGYYSIHEIPNSNN